MPQLGKQMKHKCVFLYSEFEMEGTRERQSVIRIQFQGRGGGHFVISLSHMNSLHCNHVWTETVTAVRRVLSFILILLIALYGFTAVVWKPDSCSYGYELRTRRHENLKTVGNNGNGFFGDTNCHNPRQKQTFAERTKVFYLRIGFLTTCIEAWRSEVTDRDVVSTSATTSPPSVTSENL